VNHPRQRRRRGAALLMVLISMATAMTLVLGWLASQDNSTLVAANSSHAATARATAQSALELAVSMLESEAPWQSSHTDGWVLQNHPMGEGTVDVRLLDELTGLPPDTATSVVRIEAIARVQDMIQTAGGLATIHPFDDESRSDMSGYVLFAANSLTIQGPSRVKSWNGSGRGARVLAAMGDTHFTGRTNRDLEDGELSLHVSDNGGVGSAGDATLPTILGVIGLVGVDLPAPLNTSDEDEPVSMHIEPSHSVALATDHDVTGDLHFDRNATLVIEANCTLSVAGNLNMEPGSAIEVAEGIEFTLVIGGDVELDGAVIGAPQDGAPRHGTWRQQQMAWTAPERIRLTTPAGGAWTDWHIGERSLVQGVIEAPTAAIKLDRSTVLGRIAGHDIDIRRGARLYYDHRAQSGRGLEALTDMVQRLDLMDLRPGGLDSFARAEMIERLGDLLTRPHGTTITSPINGWWMQRPVPVETIMTRCGGDIDSWEANAIATADGETRP
jgi:Tfp pilus assembly protein PilX